MYSQNDYFLTLNSLVRSILDQHQTILHEAEDKILSIIY